MARLNVLAAGVLGDQGIAERNVTHVNDRRRTRIVVMEGDEETIEGDPIGRSSSNPLRIAMTPQMVIVCREKVEDVGQVLNEVRADLIDAVVNDATLKAMTLNGRGAHYDGMESDLAFGRQQIGQMALRFRIVTVMRPGATAPTA